MSIWFTSDTHFCHSTVARLRGFATADEHDEAIITTWNKLVRPGDFVWHLGDVGLGPETRLLERAARLNGSKHLITGNHDRCWPGHRDGRKHQRPWLEVFGTVQAFGKIRVDGRTVLLSHFPYQGGGDHTDEERHVQFRLPDLGGWLIHGHTHQAGRIDGPRSLHAGLDAWGLAPVREDRLAAMMRDTGETGAA